MAPEPHEAGEAATAPPDDRELADLTRIRGEITAALETQQERAQASAVAVRDLEQQQTDLLAAGLDAAGLRPRLRDARDDLAEWARSIALLRQRLEETYSQIASVGSRAELAGLRGELAQAVAELDELGGREGERQRAAVLAIRDAAVEFTAVYSEREAAAARVRQLAQAVAAKAQAAGEPGPDVPPAVITMLSVPGDANAGPQLALLQAIHQARQGNVAAVALRLGEAFGWLPPAPPTTEELAQQRQVAEQREKQLAGMKAKQELGPGGSPSGETTDLWNGQPVPVHMPHPLDVFRAPGSPGNYGPGYRTGW